MGHTVLEYVETAEQTKFLIESGADVNAYDKDGKTALMKATSAEQVKLLIEAGADIYAKDKNRLTALDILPEEITACIRKKAEYDKAGLKIDNQMAQARGKTAKTIDEKLGSNLSGIRMPEWVKKAETHLTKRIENAKKKVETLKSKQSKQSTIAKNR